MTYALKIAVKPLDGKNVAGLKAAADALKQTYDTLKDFDLKGKIKGKTAKGMSVADYSAVLFLACDLIHPKELRAAKRDKNAAQGNINWTKAFKHYTGGGALPDNVVEFIFDIPTEYLPPKDEELTKELKRLKDPKGLKAAQLIKDDMLERIKFAGKLALTAYKLSKQIEDMNKHMSVVIPQFRITQSFEQFQIAEKKGEE